MKLKIFFFLFLLSFFFCAFQILDFKVQKKEIDSLDEALMRFKQQNTKLEEIISKLENSNEIENFLLSLNLEKRDYKEIKKIKIASKTALK